MNLKGPFQVSGGEFGGRVPEPELQNSEWPCGPAFSCLQSPLLQDSWFSFLTWQWAGDKPHGVSVPMSLVLPWWEEKRVDSKGRGWQGEAKGKSARHSLLHLTSWVSECCMDRAADQKPL